MTVTIQDINSIGAGVRFSLVAAGDSYAILPGVTVGSTTTQAINFSAANQTLDIGGTLVSSLQMSATSASVSVSIGSSGRFVSFDPTTGNAALFFLGAGSRLDNAGDFISERCVAVLTAGGCDVVNSGRIVGASGVFIGLSSGVGDTLINSGEITANRAGDTVQNSRLNNAVFAEGQNARISNLASGIITAVSSEGAGVRLGFGADGSIVFNDGLIEATTWYGVDFSSMNVSEFGRLSNTGTIRGFQGSFNGNDTTDIVVNRGRMVGHVQMNDGSDRYDGRGGQVDGEIFGGNGNDTLLGGDFAETISGEANIDTIRGGGGDDVLYGGFNSDLLRGDAGDDELYGGQDFDDMAGGTGNDTMHGGDYGLFGYGGEGDDLIQTDNSATAWFIGGYGGAGDDTLLGGMIGDTVAGGAGNDVLSTFAGADQISGGLGDDAIGSGDGDDTVYGDGGDDAISNTVGNARLFGGTGLDTITGGDGNDTLDGGSGDDVLDGGNDNDVMTGSFGEDVLLGNAGNDTLDGGNQDDNLTGGGGADVMRGGRGADVLTGETGRDTMTGGAGGDTFVFSATSHSAVGVNADVIDDFTRGADVIDISGMAALTFLFRAGNPFAGGGAASVRFDVVGNVTTVRIDANGDAVADSEVILNGVSTLAATDFLL